MRAQVQSRGISRRKVISARVPRAWERSLSLAVAGVSRLTSRPQPRQCRRATRANSSFMKSFTSVIVPTVDRDVRMGSV